MTVRLFCGLCAFGFLLLAGHVSAQDAAPPPPGPEQMKAVRACAAKQGVDLPPPPGLASVDGQNAGVPQSQISHHLSNDQKAIIDSCFRQNNLASPQHHGAGAEMASPDGSDSSASDKAMRLGPPPEQDFH